MSRVGACLLLTSFMSACGGSTSSPSTNSAAFPDLRGTWVGSRTIEARAENGTATNNVCAERWMVHTQSGGTFAGSFETGGAPCLQQAGSIDGTITASGAIATLSINLGLGPGAPCSVVTQTALSGGVIGRTMNIRFSDEIVCSSGSGTFQTTKRTVAIELTR